ncbi:hypothetical protein SNEBB_001854 [Seison nebaliae]|nr:hypothetical protein SNEBB_001854 [Seison nebaliae]
MSELECEVCSKFLEKFAKTIESGTSTPVIEKELKKTCEKSKGKDERFCYYIGGLKTSATSIIGEISKPLSWGMPAEKICRDKLKKKDPQICELKYDKAIDWKNVNLKKMKVKDLKKILANWGETCTGCFEKSEYIRRINELKPKHVPDEL